MQLDKLANSYLRRGFKVKNKTNIKEDVTYGIYDRPGPTGKIADAEEETTVPDEVPLDPSPQMSNQLSVQRPPIEDEEYVPASIEELTRAASAISQLVPKSAIESYYRDLHRILDDATEKAAQDTQDQDDLSAGTDSPAVTEEAIRKELRLMLLEALSDEDLRDYEDFRGGYSVIEPDEDYSEVKTKSSGEMSLEDLAQEFGYSGPTGIRQHIEKITNRLEYMAKVVKKDDLDALVNYGVGEYIDSLEESDLLGTEDIEELRSASGMVKDLDSFKYFFVSALVMPAWTKITKQATKNVKTAVANLGLPTELQQTVLNQATGGSERGAKGAMTIKKKLDKLVNAGKITSEESAEIGQKIRDSMADLVETATSYSDDFIRMALEMWKSTSKKKRQDVLRQAMEKTV